MRKGFTLAEVLITLTIIGVIAALTIPNLMRKWRDYSDVQKVKEAHAILSNAWTMCVSERGLPEEWKWEKTLPAYVKLRPLIECMMPYLKVKENCISNLSSKSHCASVPKSGGFDSYLYLNGKSIGWGGYIGHNSGAGAGDFILLENNIAIGTAGIGYISKDTTKGPYESQPQNWSNTPTALEGIIYVDINGKNKPNRYGYDVFRFSIQGAKLRPYLAKQGYYHSSTKADCGKPSTSGTTCSYWVIKHGNMDYKYRDVSAEW